MTISEAKTWKRGESVPVHVTILGQLRLYEDQREQSVNVRDLEMVHHKTRLCEVKDRRRIEEEVLPLVPQGIGLILPGMTHVDQVRLCEDLKVHPRRDQGILL